jgi:hypothetical protein
MHLGRAGLIVHPSAGRGEEAMRDLLPVLLSQIESDSLFVIAETFATAAAEGARVKFEQIGVPITSDLSFIEKAVAVMLDKQVDTLIGVGGDGTLCTIANTIVTYGGKVRLLGIGAGSSNVGPLVTVRGKDLERLDLSCLVERPIHGIEVQVNNKPAGIAFNDVTFSNLFFGTNEGARVDLDARAMLNGVRQETRPCSVCGEETQIYKNGALMIDAQDTPIGQIIASPINDPLPYSGKAISGLMCWGPYLGKEGVLTAADAVLIRTHIDIDTLEMVEPLHLRQVSFGDGDTIEVVGLETDAVVIADGNPICSLLPADRVTLRLRRSVLRAFRKIS